MPQPGFYFLDVDLTAGTCTTFVTPAGYRDAFLGGASLAAKLMMDFSAWKGSPLSPGNILIFAGGPLSGANFPGAGRIHIAARSPLTGLWGESSMGGFLAAPLKASGYDGIILRGRANAPVFLEVGGDEKTCRIHAANDLWGRDSFETEEALHRRFSPRKIEVAAIGQAGELLVPMAAIIHRKHNIAARTGMGAVMGSKNLKAVVVHSAGRAPVANPEKLAELAHECYQALNEDYWAQRRRKWGTVGNLQWSVEQKRTPTKNWLDVDWQDDARAITGETIANTYLTGRATCYGCPLACKRVVKVDEPGYDVQRGPGPEYKSAAGLGAMLLNNNLPAFLKANDLCNRLGIDTISAGSTIAWAMEAYEKGLLDERWTGGKALKWGDGESVVDLVKQMGRRTGLGALLCQGSAAAAGQVGGGSIEFAIEVKGLEVAYHHPRAARGMEITYATNPRGATHMESPDVLEFKNATNQEWVARIARTVDKSSLPNSYVLCTFIYWAMGIDGIGKVLEAVTGDEWDAERQIDCAERGWYLKRLFNLKCGAGREADTLPRRIQQQLVAAGCDHNNFQDLLRLYQDYRQLDEKGWPKAEKLRSLGLESLLDNQGQANG